MALGGLGAGDSIKHETVQHCGGVGSKTRNFFVSCARCARAVHTRPPCATANSETKSGICRMFCRGQGSGGPCTVAVGSITNRCRSPAPSVRRHARDSRVFHLGTELLQYEFSAHFVLPPLLCLWIKVTAGHSWLPEVVIVGPATALDGKTDRMRLRKYHATDLDHSPPYRRSQVEYANIWPNISCSTVAQCVAVRARISMRVQLLYSLPLTTNPAIQAWRIPSSKGANEGLGKVTRNPEPHKGVSLTH